MMLFVLSCEVQWMSLLDPGPGNRTENPVLRKANRGHAQHKQHQSIISAEPAGNCVFVQCFWKVRHSEALNIYFCPNILIFNVFHVSCVFVFQDLHKCSRVEELSVAVVKAQTVTVNVKNLMSKITWHGRIISFGVDKLLLSEWCFIPVVAKCSLTARYCFTP